MSVTQHDNNVGETYALPNGNNLWSAILIALGKTGMHLGHKRWFMRVESGGPVAVGKKTLTALTDGAQYAVGEWKEEIANPKQIVDGTKINIFGSGNAVIYLEASNI